MRLCVNSDLSFYLCKYKLYGDDHVGNNFLLHRLLDSKLQEVQCSVFPVVVGCQNKQPMTISGCIALGADVYKIVLRLHFDFGKQFLGPVDNSG